MITKLQQYLLYEEEVQTVDTLKFLLPRNALSPPPQYILFRIVYIAPKLKKSLIGRTLPPYETVMSWDELNEVAADSKESSSQACSWD